MKIVKQEQLPFVGMSHQFIGAEQGFVREGRGRWTVNGESFEAGPGDILVIKAGEIHTISVSGGPPHNHHSRTGHETVL